MIWDVNVQKESLHTKKGKKQRINENEKEG